MLIMVLPEVTISGRVDGKVKHVNPKSCSSSLQLREKFNSELWWTTTAATKEMTEIFIFWHLFLHLVHEILILGNWMIQYKCWWWCWDYCRGTAGLDLESGQSMLMQSQHPHPPPPPPQHCTGSHTEKKRYKNTEASVKSTDATSGWIIFLQPVYLWQYWDERCKVDKTSLFKHKSP